MSQQKLVRDNIVKIIEQNGEKPKYRVLEDDEYVDALHKKLFEEVSEFVEEDSLEELADVMEVIYSIARVKNIDLMQVERIRRDKRNARGGFEKRIYLEGVENELKK